MESGCSAVKNVVETEQRDRPLYAKDVPQGALIQSENSPHHVYLVTNKQNPYRYVRLTDGEFVADGDFRVTRLASPVTIRPSSC